MSDFSDEAIEKAAAEIAFRLNMEVLDLLSDGRRELYIWVATAALEAGAEVMGR